MVLHRLTLRTVELIDSGISYERYPVHGTKQAKELTKTSLEKQKATENDHFIAKALQEELDRQEAMNLFHEEENLQFSNEVPVYPSFGNRQARLNSTPNLRTATVQNNRPIPHGGQSGNQEDLGVNEYEVSIILIQEWLALEEDLGKVEIGLSKEQLAALPYYVKTSSLPKQFKRYPVVQKLCNLHGGLSEQSEDRNFALQSSLRQRLHHNLAQQAQNLPGLQS